MYVCARLGFSIHLQSSNRVPRKAPIPLTLLMRTPFAPQWTSKRPPIRFGNPRVEV